MDRELLEGLFRRYSASVFRRARAILGDGDAARDATQEVFLRAMKAPAEFCGADSSFAWLYRVTTNLCLTRLRDAERQRSILRRTFTSETAAVEPPVDAALTVQALLRDIPEELQEIAVFYFVDRMSQDEIADLLGLPRRTIGYRLQQFRSLTRAGSEDRVLAS